MAIKLNKLTVAGRDFADTYTKVVNISGSFQSATNLGAGISLSTWWTKEDSVVGLPPIQTVQLQSSPEDVLVAVGKAPWPDSEKNPPPTNVAAWAYWCIRNNEDYQGEME